MASDEERFDGVLLSIAQNISKEHGGIAELLDVFLGFLRRKTDAFNPPGGFPQLESSFVEALKRQYDVGQEQRRHSQAKSAAKTTTKPSTSAGTTTATAARDAVPAKATVPIFEVSPDGSIDVSSSPPPVPVVASSVAPAAISSKATASVSAATTARDTAPAAASRELEASEELRGLPGNGGSTDRYVWTQTLDDLQIMFDLPPGSRAKDVICDIKTKSIKVVVQSKVLLSAPLPKRVKADESYWTLDDSSSVVGGKVLSVYLTKEAGMEWWDRVADGEPCIDVTKIQPENSKLSDLDSGTRSTVEKMMFDQRQKALGKPTSDEMQKQEILAKFMKAHPEMDFSNAKIS